MKRFLLLLPLALLACEGSVTDPAVKPSFAGGTVKLKTFGTGVVTITGTDNGTIVNDAGEFGGIFQSKAQGKALGSAVFQFTSRGDVQGGAPRFSIPVDDGVFDVNSDYAFLDAAGCGATVGPNTTVATLVSTQNPACHVNFHGTDYANWATFANAHQTFTVKRGYIPFIIADAAGSYNVTDIVLR